MDDEKSATRKTCLRKNMNTQFNFMIRNHGFRPVHDHAGLRIRPQLCCQSCEQVSNVIRMMQ